MERIHRVRVALALAGALSCAAAAVAPLAGIEPAPFGEVFPAGLFVNLNSGAGGPPKVDLSAVIGKKPVVLCYWIAGNGRAEQVLLELQKLAGEIGPDRLALFAVATTPVGSTDVGPIRDRVQGLRLHVPVLYDEGFRIGQQLDVRTVPHIAILDAEGKLRLANGAALRQTLEYKLDLEAAIRRVASTGQLGTYGYLAPYYPATELVGRKSPDFEAPPIEGGPAKRLASLLAADRVNVLIFWSVDCPHCREVLPRINEWSRQQGERINVIGCARVSNDAMRVKTEEFCRQNGIHFPTLVDRDMKVGQLYQVISTPTTFIIGPSGVVDSVLLSGDTDVVKTLEAKTRRLFGARPAS